jgi:SSS family solute:Na+ symporter
MNNSFLLLFVIYIVTGTAITVIVYKAKQNQEDYFIGGRRIGAVLSALTYAATTYSAFMMVGLVGLSYQTGVGALIFELSYLVGTAVLLKIYGVKIWALGREKGAVSPMELISMRYGRLPGIVGTSVAIGALIPYTSVQIIGFALIAQSFGGFAFTTGVVFATVIIALWSLLGGLRGVALTDAFQGIFMIVFALAGFLWARSRFNGFELQQFPSEFWTISRFVNFTLPWFFFALTNPQVLQRLFILKDKNSLKRMILYFVIFGFFYTVIVTLIGFTAKYGTNAGLFPVVQDRDSVILQLLSMMGSWLAIPVALSIIFASVSTANSIILTLSSMVLRNLFKIKDKIWMGRGFIILLSFVVLFFSLQRPNYIVELSVASSAILLSFLPLLFGLFHWKLGGKLAGIFALIGGAGSAVVFRAAGTNFSSLFTIIAAFTAFFIGAFFDSFVKRRSYTTAA